MVSRAVNRTGYQNDRAASSGAKISCASSCQTPAEIVDLSRACAPAQPRRRGRVLMGCARTWRVHRPYYTAASRAMKERSIVTRLTLAKADPSRGPEHERNAQGAGCLPRSSLPEHGYHAINECFDCSSRCGIACSFHYFNLLAQMKCAELSPHLERAYEPAKTAAHGAKEHLWSKDYQVYWHRRDFTHGLCLVKQSQENQLAPRCHRLDSRLYSGPGLSSRYQAPATLFQWLGAAVNKVMDFAMDGATFVFGDTITLRQVLQARSRATARRVRFAIRHRHQHYLRQRLCALGYYFGILQRIVNSMGSCCARQWV